MTDTFLLGTRRTLKNVATVEACQLLCVNETGCVGYSYITEKSSTVSNHKQCTLNSDATGTSMYTGVIAGQVCPGNKQISWLSPLLKHSQEGKGLFKYLAENMQDF